MKQHESEISRLRAENQALRDQLNDAWETLGAIREGRVDALVIGLPGNERVYTLKGADHPYRILVETINEGALTLSPDGVVLYANDSIASLLQISLSEFIGADFGSFVPENHRSIFEALLQRGITSGQRCEINVESGSGSLVPVHLSASPFSWDDTGVGLCIVVTDLTEQKRNQAILEAEQLASSILEQASEAIVVLDDAGRIVRASQMAAELAGQNPLFKKFEDVFPLDIGVDQWKADGHRTYETTLPRSNGAPVFLLVSCGPLKDTKGVRLGSVVSLTDISELKRATEALRLGEERFRVAIDGSPIIVYQTDVKARYTWVYNPQQGFTSDQIIGKTDFELLPADVVRDLMALKKRVLRSGKSAHEEVCLRFPDHAVWYEVVAEPLRDESGNITGLTAAGTDITSHKKLVQELRELNEQLEARVIERTTELTQKTAEVRALASALTLAEQRERKRIAQLLHDELQQMLHGIQLKMQVLRMEVMTGEMQQALERMSLLDRLMRDAIKMARSLAIELSPPVLKGKGLRTAMEWLVVQMEDAHGLKVDLSATGECEIPAEDLRILLYQIARELLFNVVKHAGTTQATLRLAQHAGEIEIVVEDQGSGFEVSGIESSSNGSFGLHSVRQRLDLVGGRLEVKSSPGKGSCVTIAVPAGLGAGEKTPSIRQARRQRIFLVEDDALVREGYTTLIEMEPDLEIVAAVSTASLALQQILEIPSDLVVVDMSLPDMDGIELVRRLHERQPELPLLVVSGHDRSTYGTVAREAGAADYVDKTDAATELVSAIRRTLSA